MEEAGYYGPVYNVVITYKKSIKLVDQIFEKAWIDLNQGLKTAYGFQIVNGEGDICAEGSTRHIVVKKEGDQFKPVQFKKAYPEWF